ncbi:hypothetical protein [Dechloromonas sp. CZR5]|uniref:hypothetical protein n=1 Tax=Dechloromonas sp. CZR5 TaxID=2608630 RepID=UPI00123E07CB|nr:hypothetical protein [Dechloromonas sp. CZR5]
MPPLNVLAAEYKLVILLLSLGGCYVWGRHDGAALEAAASVRETAVAERAVAAAQEGAAKEIAKLEIKHVTLQQRIERETREIPVYRDCRHSADGLQQLNAALENRSVPADGGQLPGNAGPGARR